MTVPSRPRTRKAVIPAAGLGTRFLPATKAMPKEMLPVVDRPAIEYVVAEARRAGLQDVLMITGRNKRALEDHFDRHPALEATLERKGDATRLAQIRESDLVGDIHYVRQGEALGLAAVLEGGERDDHVQRPVPAGLGQREQLVRDRLVQPPRGDVRRGDRAERRA